MNLKYISVFIIGLLIGSIGMYSIQDTSNNKFQIGDSVASTPDWDEWYEPLNGNVTAIDNYDGNILITIDTQEGRWINQDWFAEV